MEDVFRIPLIIATWSIALLIVITVILFIIGMILGFIQG